MLNQAASAVRGNYPDRDPGASSNPTRLHAPASGPRMLELHAVNAADDAARLLSGLLATPALTDPKFFYDAQGSALFDAICHLDEYHPTGTESTIFKHHRADIAQSIRADLGVGIQWVDLGAGDAAKSREWLSAVPARRYIGVDIAEAWLRPAVARVAEAFPKIEAIGVVADLTRPLALAPLLAETPESPPLFFYPGSSIGNFPPDRALNLLRAIRQLCVGQDGAEHGAAGRGGRGQLLIGVDCESDVGRLTAAYDDALGVTAAFNRNLLRVANRLLGADFDPRAFGHRAVFNAVESRVEMHLVSSRAQTVRFTEPQDAVRDFAAGEPIVTEYSYKYSPQRFADLLAAAGFRRHRLWQDADRRFAVFLAAV